jgi:hypothetical protein
MLGDKALHFISELERLIREVRTGALQVNDGMITVVSILSHVENPSAAAGCSDKR